MVGRYHRMGMLAYLLRVDNLVFYKQKIIKYLFLLFFIVLPPPLMGFHYPTNHLQ